LINIIRLIVILRLGLSAILIVVNSILGKKNLQEREKPSAFECGFDPKRRSRLPFSLRFYLIAVIFLIFDVEITLILPIPVILVNTNINALILISSFFIVILVVGLLHEWKQGALEWK